MSLLDRLLYALVFSIVAGSITILVTALINPDWMVSFIKYPYGVLVLAVVGFLFAPMLNRYVRLRRK